MTIKSRKQLSPISKQAPEHYRNAQEATEAFYQWWYSCGPRWLNGTGENQRNLALRAWLRSTE